MLDTTAFQAALAARARYSKGPAFGCRLALCHLLTLEQRRKSKESEASLLEKDLVALR